MKCWNSAFNAQGSRVIIVVVHVGAVQIYVALYVAAVALKKKETQDESLPPELVGKLVWVPAQNWPF
jgi:NADH:ubiquinone oxidoreductase subunit 6 (subunit J)